MARTRGRRKHKSRDIVQKGENQEYALVTQKLGDCRFILSCQDKVERMGHLRGNMRNRNYVREGDYVLISFRKDYSKLSLIKSNGKQLEYCDIILKYFENEVNILKANGHIKDIESDPELDTEFDELIQSSTTDSNNQQVSNETMGIDTDDIDI